MKSMTVDESRNAAKNAEELACRLCPSERYFEVWFDTTPPISICIRGFREPTILEAQKFCEDHDTDVARIAKVYNVDEISFDEACQHFDMQNVDEWPAFGHEEMIAQALQAWNLIP